MLKYEYQYKNKPFSELDVYCREEGLDPLYILGSVKKEKNPEKSLNVMGAFKRLFSKRMQYMKIFGLSGQR